MIELPRAPHDISYELFTHAGSSDPIDVLGDRDGSAVLVICHFDGGPMHVLFSGTDEPVDAEDSMPLDFYTVIEISSATRFMTLACRRPASAYWYVA